VPYFRRPGKPDIFYEIDDYTDPWKPAPTILLQHGAARSSLFWRAWVPYLSRFYRVLRPDLRGLGRSGKHQAADCGINFQGYRDDLIDLLDHLGIESVHYCGESSAGTLGMVLAAQCPERVRTLSLVSAPVSMSEEDKTSALGGYANRIEALRNLGCRGWLEASNAGRRFPADADPAMLAWSLAEMGKTDVEVMIAIFQWASQVDARPSLPKISAPVLGLYPASGIIATDVHVDLLKQLVRNVRIVRVASRAHSLQVVHPALCAREVLYFIAQCDGIACRE